MLKNDSKKILLSIFGIAFLIIAITGVTYAIFTYTSHTSTSNEISTGSISMSYVESDTNVISIDGAMPMSDEVGKIQNQYFEFKVASKISGKATIGYEIRAEQIPTENPIDSQKVKLYLEKENSGKYESVLKPTSFKTDSKSTIPTESFGDMYLYSTNLTNTTSSTKEFSDSYRLRMWISDGYQIEAQPKSFKVKINVSART